MEDLRFRRYQRIQGAGETLVDSVGNWFLCVRESYHGCSPLFLFDIGPATSEVVSEIELPYIEWWLGFRRPEVDASIYGRCFGTLIGIQLLACQQRLHHANRSQVEFNRMLDVHIAETIEDASRSNPVFRFDAKVHELIFSRDNVPIERFKLFMRLRDYYADALFTASELPALMFEIQSLIELLPSTNSLVSVLDQFRSVCVTAASTQKNLYLFCD